MALPITTPEEISRETANVVFSDREMFVRGIGSGNSFGFDPSVPVFVDGVYLGRATAALMPLMDLERIEIIRGPQGTLLGKNTIGGAVNLVTPQPGAESGLFAQLRHGDLDRYGIRVNANLAIEEDWGLRLAAQRESIDGHVYNSTRDFDTLGRMSDGVRAKLAWLPAGPVSAWLSVEDSENRLTALGQQLSAATDSSLALYRLYDPATEAIVDDRTSTDAEPSGGTRDGRSITLNASYAFDTAEFTSLTNLTNADFDIQLDVDFSPVPLLFLEVAEGYEQFSQELRVNGRWLDADYIAGAYFLRSNLRVLNTVTLLPEGSTGVVAGADVADFFDLLPAPLLPPEVDLLADESRKNFRQAGQAFALYGQLGWWLTPRWQLTGGLRWTHERKEAYASNAFKGSGLVFRQFLGEEPYEVERRLAEDDISPKVSVQFAATPRLALYAAAARGFKGGGFNDVAPRPAMVEYDNERSDNIELGLKGTFLDGVLGLNVSAFSTRLEGLQVNAWDGTSYYVQNAARVASRGVEVESRWQVGYGWRARISAGYLDAHYVSFPNAPARADQDADSQDLSGARLMRAPRFSGMVALDYSSQLFGMGPAWGFGIDVQHRDHLYLNLDNDPLDAQAAHTLCNAWVGFGDARGIWSLRFTGRNLTNVTTVKEAGDVPLFSGNHYATVEQPRRYQLAFNLRW